MVTPIIRGSVDTPNSEAVTTPIGITISAEDVLEMGRSASFMPRFANGVSLMVYRPGGFRFGDFWKLGLPVTIWALIVTVIVVPPYWKFRLGFV